MATSRSHALKTLVQTSGIAPPELCRVLLEGFKCVDTVVADNDRDQVAAVPLERLRVKA